MSISKSEGGSSEAGNTVDDKIKVKKKCGCIIETVRELCEQVTRAQGRADQRSV